MKIEWSPFTTMYPADVRSVYTKKIPVRKVEKSEKSSTDMNKKESDRWMIDLEA